MRTVILTFDDAVISQYENVAPLLKALGFGATFFICRFNDEWREKNGQYLMTGEQIRQLDSAGFEIANHTWNHPDLRKLSEQEIEQEISDLGDDEKAEYLDAMGITESGLDKLVKASYRLLNLISFLTAGEDECRAWTITKGTKAPQAAGKIHTDFERGFIRAQTIAYDKLMECGGSMAAAKEKGLIRDEGKEYVVQDGDIITFMFNV